MVELVETRWRRYGHDRVYVRTSDGVEVGHVDLTKGEIVTVTPQHQGALEDCLRRWTGEPAVLVSETPEAPPTPTLPSLPPSPPPAVPSSSQANDRDLSSTVAGAAARAKREEVNEATPIRNMIARVLGMKTEERAWRVGAKGEEKVAAQLAKLGPAWRVLHAVEVGENGSDIDHVLIGPAGVFTLNAKRHPRGNAWVAENCVMVNGQKTDYLRNSRHEAKRAARLLSAACGQPIAVTPVVVFVDLDSFKVKSKPTDVAVVTRSSLVTWLTSKSAVLTNTDVDAIYAKARFASTWRPA